MLENYKSIGNALKAIGMGLKGAISNADNINTPGFKTTFYTFVQSGVMTYSGATTTQNPMQTAVSMTLGTTSTDFSQGNISFGTNMDAAIVGEGFFVLSKSSTEVSPDLEKVYTRGGKFLLDPSNNFVTDAFGRRVFGYKVDASGNPVDRTLVPIQTDGNTDVGFKDGGIFVANFQKHKDDVANNVNPPTEEKPLYRIALQTFQNKQGLTLVEGGYQKSAASGDALDSGISNEGVYGNIRGGSLEAPNIDIAKVALDMALYNRMIAAVQGMIDDLNKISSGLISKLQ